MDAMLNVADSIGRNSVCNSECTRSPLNDRTETSFAAFEVLTAGNQLRVCRENHSSGCQSAKSEARKYTPFAQSFLMRLRRRRRQRTVSPMSQTAVAAKRIKRLVARQNRFSAQKISFTATRTVKEKEHSPGDQTLLSLPLDSVAPAFREPSGLEVSSSVERPLCASVVHSVHLSGVDQLDSQQVREYDNEFSICSILNLF